MDNWSVLYVEIDILVAIYIFIMVSNLWKTRKASHSDKSFFWGVTSIGIVLITDILAVVLNGMPGMFVHGFLYLDNALYFIFSSLASYNCLIYVDYMISDNSVSVNDRIILYSLPAALVTILVLASFKYNFIFYIDNANSYHRGNFHVFQQIVTILYFIIAMSFSVFNYAIAKNLNKKYTSGKMIVFTGVPLVGMILQILFPQAAIIWPFVSIAMFIIFTNLQNSQISLDPLTGLNNRDRMLKYLKEMCDKTDIEHILTCAVLDIDNFKSINDRYGHAVGDEAICDVAEVVKASVVRVEGSHFVARYTGNSFVIISYDKVSHAEDLKESFEAELDEFNNSLSHKYQLSVTFGLVEYIKSQMSADDFLKAADDEMYKNKAIQQSGKVKLNVEDVIN